MTDTMTAAEIPTFTLNDGNRMPGIGMGCWMGSVGVSEEAARTTELALKLGYRHIDTAAAYGNEEVVGKVVRDSNIPRKDIFITTKLPSQDHGNVAKACDTSLRALGMDYVDLYLMHWPQANDPSTGRVLQLDESPTFVETWLEMEKLKTAGKAKSIGVSNFAVKHLEVLLPKVNIVPAVNQIEAHPCLPNSDLIAYSKEKGMVVTAYTPMGRPDAPFYNDSTFLALAKKYNVAVGQILLSWAIQRGTAPIPKSSNPERAKQNVTLVTLSKEDMAAIDSFHKKPGMHRTLAYTNMCEGNMVFGWTFEQLGWNMGDGGYVNA